MARVRILPEVKEFLILEARALPVPLFFKHPSEPIMIEGMDEIADLVCRVNRHQLPVFGGGPVEIALFPAGPGQDVLAYITLDFYFKVRLAALEVYRALRDVSDVSDHALRTDPGDQALARQRQVHRPAERKGQADRPDRILVQYQYPSAEAGAHGQVVASKDSGRCAIRTFLPGWHTKNQGQ
jgi:hypothetical protein